MPRAVPPLWECRDCGRRFAKRNQTHTCGLATIDRHFADRPPKIRALFDAIRREIDLVFARRIEHPRSRNIETISRRNHVHHFRITSVEDIDAEFVEWLAEAYAVGEQRHLA